jgi:hypothetical protein
MNRELFISTIFIFWIALGIIGTILFYFSKNVQFKKKYFRWYIILIGVLFTFWIGVSEPWLVVLFFILPAVSLISFLNIKYTIFCDNCGRTVYNNPWLSNPWFSKVEYCAKCGAKLKE